jgi:hypothetical protein
MSILAIRAGKISIAVFVAVAVCGCGSGTRPQAIEPPLDPKEALHQEGLSLALKSDKAVYQKGEMVRFWLSVANTASRTRSLELHPLYDEPGARTYGYGVFYYDPNGHDYQGVWGTNCTEQITRQIHPGEEIRLVEVVWDQTTLDGSAAGLGYYDAFVVLSNLYVDGRQYSQVSGWKLIQIQE